MVKCKKSKVTIGFLLVVILMFSSMTTVFASTKVNDKEVKVGDTVSYVLKLKDIKEKKLVGINVSIKYDDTSLEILKDTATLPAFADAIYNLDKTGMIYFNAINVAKGYPITDDTIIFSVSYKVKDNAKDNIEIKANIEEIYSDYDTSGPIEAKGYEVVETVQEGTLPDIVKPSSVEEIEASVSEADKDATTTSNPTSQTNSNTLIMVIGGVIVAGLLITVVILTVKMKNRSN